MKAYLDIVRKILEKGTLKHLIPQAQECQLMDEEEINTIFVFHPKIKLDFKPRRLLDKFIHGAYSELFALVQGVTIEGQGKGKDFEDFIQKMPEQDKPMKFGESFTRSTYVRLLLREELSLFFICALFKVAKVIFYERLPKLLIG